jgi:DNA-binding protein H-NS
MALKSMPIAKLQDLKSKIEAALSAKVTERRRELESELSKLAGFAGGGKAKSARSGRMGPVAPKYRNPDNPAETWAGRGLRPRWLTAAMKGGKSLEDFAIGGATKASAASKANGRKKAVAATAKTKAVEADVCPICDFQTTPPRDRRAHRYQKKKAPLSAEELKEKGLTKV